MQLKNLVLHCLVQTWDPKLFGRNHGIDFGVMLREKGPHKPQFFYDLVHIHSLMIYLDLTEYNIVDITKTPLVRCFIFISKLKAGDIKTTGQYMNYQSFSKLQIQTAAQKKFIVSKLN